MLKSLDKEIIKKYGIACLENLSNVNMKLVPEDYIESMKCALALQEPPPEPACFHAFFGWDVSKFALKRKTRNPLDMLFEDMKGTFLPSCETVCLNPESHFKGYVSCNKCFPIKKVFEVLNTISPNTANRLLDIGLIDILYTQIKEKKRKEELLIYSINRSKFTIFRHFLSKISKQDFKVLIVDFDMLLLNEINRNDDSVDEFNKFNFLNLIQNIESNFNCTLVEKPYRNQNKWIEYIDNQIECADIFVAVISLTMLHLLLDWQTILIGNQSNQSLTSVVLEQMDFQKFKEDMLNDNVKYQYLMYKKMYMADKIKIAIAYDENLMPEIIKFFPITFVVPKEIKKVLFMLEEIRK